MRLASLVLSACIAAHATAYGPARRIGSYAIPVSAFEAGDGEAILNLQCSSCSWADAGREAVVLRVTVDGRYASHVVVPRSEPSVYPVALGALEAGRHELALDVDEDLSARGAGEVALLRPPYHGVHDGPDREIDSAARSMAPYVYARANTVGRFTDLPILMWYETTETPRGRTFRYSVIFTNEDGGTPTDRLMATWGRTTDIEFVYGVEVDGNGAVLAEEFQGPSHQIQPFRGKHEGRHPLLWVATDNNMVSDQGTTTIRYGLVPERFDLTHRSREAVMDAHSWSYVLMAEELRREEKIAADAEPGSGKIPDPRRFVFVEACTELQNAALAFGVRAADETGTKQWYESDRGRPDFRIVRTGCFRGAVPVPARTARIDAVGFRAYSPPADRATAATPAASVTRVNKVFMLDDAYLPRASMFGWTGTLPLTIDGERRDLPF